MDEIFTNLEKEGKTDVGNLVKWMQDSKLIENTAEEEERVRSMFSSVGDSEHVKLDEFKSVISKLAEEKSKTLDELMKQLADEGPNLMRAATAGLGAFKDALQGNC